MMLERTTPQSGRRWWLGKLAELLVVAGIVAILIALLIPAIQRPRADSEWRHQCENGLRNLYLALDAYDAKHGSLPAAIVSVEAAMPPQSWRTQLLPFLGYPEVYENYDLDEDWNADANLDLSRSAYLAQLFLCWSNERAVSDDRPVTNYVAVVGDGTAWPGDRAIKLSDIKDDPSSTILLVEMAESDIAILEPRDLQFAQLPLQINPPAGKGISSHHAGGANVLMADGSVRFLPDDLPAEVLRAMLTINGGEAIDLERL